MLYCFKVKMTEFFYYFFYSVITVYRSRVEGLTKMKSDLESEKHALAHIWKQHKKQLQKVLDNTTRMYGSIRGIARSALESIPALELPYQDETA